VLNFENQLYVQRLNEFLLQEDKTIWFSVNACYLLSFKGIDYRLSQSAYGKINPPCSCFLSSPKYPDWFSDPPNLLLNGYWR